MHNYHVIQIDRRELALRACVGAMNFERVEVKIILFFFFFSRKRCRFKLYKCHHRDLRVNLPLDSAGKGMALSCTPVIPGHFSCISRMGLPSSLPIRLEEWESGIHREIMKGP